MDRGGNRIVMRDNLAALREMETGSVELIYVDPPFNTGREQHRPQMKTVRDEAGDRVGFGGRRYRTEMVRASARRGVRRSLRTISCGFVRPRMEEAYRVSPARGRCSSTSTIARCTTAKVMLDEVFSAG